MEFKQVAEHADYLTFTQTDAPEGLDPVRVEIPRALHNLTLKDGTLSMSVHLPPHPAKEAAPVAKPKPSVVGYTDNDRHAPRIEDNVRPAGAPKDETKPEPTADIPYTDNLRENDPGAIDVAAPEPVPAVETATPREFLKMAGVAQEAPEPKPAPKSPPKPQSTRALPKAAKK